MTGHEGLLVALASARAVASGGSFLKWRAPRPQRVLYIDGEMPAVEMQARLARWARRRRRWTS